MKILTITRDIERQYYWILPDDMLTPPKDVLDQGFPMIVGYRPEKTIRFTAELQNFIWNLNRTSDEPQDRKSFQGYIDTWNSQAKLRDHYNAIMGEGDPNDLPGWQCNIGMGANVLCGTEEISLGIQTHGIKIGIPVLRMETIDPNNLPHNINYATHPHLIHHAVIIRPNSIDGYQMRNPFPQMGGRMGRPCYLAVISPIPMFFEMSKLRKLAIGDPIPNPYNPEWIGFPKV